MATEVSPGTDIGGVMQFDLGGHPAQADAERLAIAGYASLVGNQVSQKGNPAGITALLHRWL